MEQDAENLQADQVSEWLREGIAAVKAGQNEHAHDLLIRVVAREEQNAQAWLWLSGVVDDLEDRKVCLENVLKIDLGNAAARKGLAWVCQQMQQQPEEQALSAHEKASPLSVPLKGASEAVSPAAAPEPPVVERTRTPVTPAAAILREDFASRRPSPEPAAASVAAEPQQPVAEPAGYEPSLESETSLELEFSPVKTQDEFSNEYACPYCAAETAPDDNRCRLCGKALWYRFRKYEKRSSWFWWLIVFQAANVLPLLILPFGVYYLGNELLEATSLYEAGGDLPSRAVITIIALVAALPGLFSGAVLAGLYFRWKVVYWLFLAEAFVEVVLSALAMAFLHPASGVPGFVSALVRVMMLFQVGGDFEWDKRRILLRTDRGLKSSVEYLTRADFYNQQKMWAMAVVHIRAALGMVPDKLNCHLALVVAYIRLKKYALAERALAEAKRISPSEPRIAQLEVLVNEIRDRQPALP
jgi:tetratricopeptide (TPR) repeat protein